MDTDWQAHTGPGWTLAAPPGFSGSGAGAPPPDEPDLTSMARVGGWIGQVPVALVISTRILDGTTLRQQAARMAAGCDGMATSGPAHITGAKGAVRVDGQVTIPEALTASGEEVVTQVLGARGDQYVQLTVRVPLDAHDGVHRDLERILASLELDGPDEEPADDQTAVA